MIPAAFSHHFAFRFCLSFLISLAMGYLPGELSAQKSEWTHQFGTSDDDQARAIVADESGVYVSGWTIGELPDQKKDGRQDSFVRRYDADGKEVWTHQFGVGTYSEGLSIAVAPSAVYVAGSSRDDIYIRGFDAEGKEVWTDRFGTVSDVNDEVRGIAADETGVYLAGSTPGSLPDQTSAGNADAFIRKYDTKGNEIWTRQFGTPNFDQVRGIALNASGVYVAGMTIGTLPEQTSAGTHDVFIRRYDSEGNEVWTRQFGTSNLDDISGIAVDDSGVYVAGSTLGELPGQTSAGGSDTFVRKFDLNGNELWTRQFGTPEYDHARGIAVHTSGVYLVAWTLGALAGQTNQGFHDAFVAQYGPDGEQLWVRQFGTSNLDDPFGISVNASGIYVAGLTGGSLEGQKNAGNVDAFVIKLDAAAISTAAGSTTHQSRAQPTSDDGER